MKIEISVKPQFHLYLTQRQCELITKMSCNHYDRVCIEASLSDGFLARWLRHIKAVGTGFGIQVSHADFRQCDTILKICENNTLLTTQESVEVGDVVCSILKALSLSNKQIAHLNWEIK
jgi:hypothetical protein